MPAALTDFSVNINPLGPPAFIRENWENYFQYIEDYPDPHARELIHSISLKEQLPEEMILAGNGAAQLIFLLGEMLRGEEVLIVEPAFSEYKEALRAFGAAISSLVLDERTGWDLDDRIFPAMRGKKAVFLCSPNNPTGKMYSRDMMLQVINAAAEAGTFIICDEAFLDFAEHAPSFAPYITRYPNIIVLKSVTKMYSLAGLRLGYVLAAPPIAAKLLAKQPHWSVNALAQVIGASCMEDSTHASKTRNYVSEERIRVTSELRKTGFTVYPSSVNFYLIDAPQKEGLYRFLLKKGIVARHTENFNGLDGDYLRFSVKTEEENDLLVHALKEWKTC